MHPILCGMMSYDDIMPSLGVFTTLTIRLAIAKIVY